MRTIKINSSPSSSSINRKNISLSNTLKHSSRKVTVKIKKKYKQAINSSKKRIEYILEPLLTKENITKIVYPLTKNDAINSFNKLKKIKCNKVKISQKVGSDFVNYFTAIERLNTKGKKYISFFDLYYNFNSYYNSVYWINNAFNNIYGDKFFNSTNSDKIKMLKNIYSMYFGNVGLFRPVISKYFACIYRPKTVLDFTMGWGGRLVGFCSENIEKYIGIDSNINLKPLYDNMVSVLTPLTSTKIELYFEDALKIDYSKLDYDFVFTSPPYYNIEIYNGTNIKSISEWNNEFYIPIIKTTYKYLNSDGYYCLNVSPKIYENICLPILGKAKEIYPLGKPPRFKTDTYTEYIYVWKK